MTPEHLPERQNDRVKRIYEETVQPKEDTTPTVWNRFATLGRNIVPFITFEALWNNFDQYPRMNDASLSFDVCVEGSREALLKFRPPHVWGLLSSIE